MKESLRRLCEPVRLLERAWFGNHNLRKAIVIHYGLKEWMFAEMAVSLLCCALILGFDVGFLDNRCPTHHLCLDIFRKLLTI
jgi:hypothetical protein